MVAPQWVWCQVLSRVPEGQGVIIISDSDNEDVITISDDSADPDVYDDSDDLRAAIKHLSNPRNLQFNGLSESIKDGDKVYVPCLGPEEGFMEVE